MKEGGFSAFRQNQTAGSVDKSPHAGNLAQAVEILDADEAHENFAKTFSPSFLQDIGWYVLGEYEAVEAPRPDLLVSQKRPFWIVCCINICWAPCFA